MRALVGLICIAAFGVSHVRDADACQRSARLLPCEQYWESELVFTAKVTQLTPLKNGVQDATLTIDQVFRGTATLKTVVITVGALECPRPLLVLGTSYFVYGTGSTTGFYAAADPVRLDLATEDLAYARALPRRARAVVEGLLTLADQSTSTPRAGVTVRAAGTAFATRTDAKGNYRLELPLGSYTLEIDDRGFYTQGNQTVQLRDAAQCARRNLQEAPNGGRIRGRLLDHVGQPAVGVEVSALQSSLPIGRGAVAQARTDRNGNFELDHILDGEYIVVANNGVPSSTQPIPPSAYPGVTTAVGAKHVTIANAGVVANINFKLAPPLPVVSISGIVRRAGKPSPHERIEVLNKTWNSGGQLHADANGRYTWSDVAGSELVLTVCVADQNVGCGNVTKRVTAASTLDLAIP